MLSNVIKNVMRIWYYEILNSNGKTCGLQLTSLMFKFSWEMLFVENGDTEAFKADRNKLFVSDEKQIDNYTISLDMLHLYMSVVCTYNCRGIFKNIFGVAIVLCWSL